MSRIALAALLLIVGLSAYVGGPTNRGRTSSEDEELLQGGWQITAVARDGEPDAREVGGFITFAGNRLFFVPRVVKVVEPEVTAALAELALG